MDKICSSCKCKKNIDFFKFKKNGIQNKTCINCNNKSKKDIDNIDILHTTDNLNRVCCKCKNTLPIDRFKEKKYINEYNKTCNNCLDKLK